MITHFQLRTGKDTKKPLKVVTGSSKTVKTFVGRAQILENDAKEELMSRLKELVVKYNRLHLNIRENNEKIRRKLNKVKRKDLY